MRFERALAKCERRGDFIEATNGNGAVAVTPICLYGDEDFFYKIVVQHPQHRHWTMADERIGGPETHWLKKRLRALGFPASTLDWTASIDNGAIGR